MEGSKNSVVVPSGNLPSATARTISIPEQYQRITQMPGANSLTTLLGTVPTTQSVKKWNVHDVASYILGKRGAMSAMKLQKLLYYCQAWSLVWDDRPLFQEEIQAWANGPVVPAVYEQHKGKFQLSEWLGNPANLDPLASETVDAVLKYYAHQNAQYLSDLSHSERPWREARMGLTEGERGNHVISLESMMEFYSSISQDNA